MRRSEKIEAAWAGGREASGTTASRSRVAKSEVRKAWKTVWGGREGGDDAEKNVRALRKAGQAACGGRENKGVRRCRGTSVTAWRRTDDCN